MRVTYRFLLSFGLAFAMAVPAAAQDRALTLNLGVGLAAVPAYPGADRYEAQPDLNFSSGSLTWGTFTLGTRRPSASQEGLSLGGSFRLIGSRDAADAPELAGLEEIDTAVELGLALTYQDRNWRAFGQIRQGFGGHDGITGTLGADLIFRPSNRITVTAGPRLHLGDADYAGTYFGVSAQEATQSDFGRFDAGGGLLGAGFQVRGSYETDGPWSVEGRISYERLQNSAADSPITQSGSADQWQLSIGLSRSFSLRF